MNMIERRDLRTGIEDWAGRPVVYRRTVPRPLCAHYCAEHDHTWEHDDPRCVRHEVLPCPEAQ